ncbi:unnamed protein product [Fusarium graminearum]|nr:unnamed protein product [Fusarium graminearum]
MAPTGSDVPFSSPKRPQTPLGPLSGPQIIEATYIMTREMAMAQAGDIKEKLGYRGFDQAALLPQMNEWLSLPVVKVLSEDMKNRVSIWCQQHNRGWLDAIRDAEDDLKEYQYTSRIQESTDTIPEIIQSRLEETLDRFRQEILQEQRETTAKMMAKMDSLQLSEQTSPPAKRRRMSTRNIPKNASLQKIDEGLRYLLGEDSELVQCFREHAVNIDPKFTTLVEPSAKRFWTKGQLENFQKETRELGLGAVEYKLLDRIFQEMEEGDLSMTNIAALSLQLTSREQYGTLKAKFRFFCVSDREQEEC